MKSVIFDLDGTLINTNELIIKSFKYVFNKYHKEIKISEEEYISFIGPTLEESFKRYFANMEHITFLIDEYRRFNKENHDNMVSIYPNVIDTLDELSKKFPLGIVSSKRRDLVMQGLNLFKITKYFKCIICADDKVLHKPNPEGILLALEKLDSANGLYVGDNVNDILAGKNANVKTVGVSWSYKLDKLKESNPDYLIYDMKELIKIAGE